MQNIKYISLFTLLLTACSSTTTDRFFSQEIAGNAGETNQVGGENSGGSSGNSSGGANNAGTAGLVNNSAGVSGTGEIAGSSGQVNSAGASGSAGTSGSAGSGTCNPITCDDYSFSHGKTDDPNVFKKSCGFIDDGCGHKIQCGGCPDFTKCGDIDRKSTVPSSRNFQNFTKVEADSNTCNGGCEFLYSSFYGFDLCTKDSVPATFDTSIYNKRLYCFNFSTTETSIPSSHCSNPKSMTALVDVVTGTKLISQDAEIWCCDSTKL